MFTLSRILLGGSAIASSGGVASYLVPYISDSGETSIFQEGSSSAYELTRLEELLGKTKSILSEWKVKFNQSRDAASAAKDKEFSTSLNLMETISNNEEALKALYDIMKSKLETLQTQSVELNKKIGEKLKLDSDSSMLRTSLSYGTQLTSLLTTWESSLSQVIGTFEKNEQSASTGSALSNSGGGAETEGQRAQKALTNAKSKFEELKKTISDTKSRIGQQQLEEALEDLAVYFKQIQAKLTITWLEQYIKLINSNIQKTNDRASLQSHEINENNEKLRKSHENYNKFKSFQANFHQFGEKFQSEIQNIDLFLKR